MQDILSTSKKPPASSSREAARVVVTGGCGFIGRALTASLLTGDCTVTVLDDLSGSIPGLLEPHPQLRSVVGCVTDRLLVAELLERATHVFHLASVVGQEAVSAEPARSFEVSERGTANVLRHLGHARGVLFSSSAVYGLAHAREAAEEAPLGEEDSLAYDGGKPGYAYGKYMLERLTLEAAERGADVLVVRPFNVVGPGQSGTHGMVLPRFAARAMLGLPLVVYDDGRQRRSFAHIEVFVDIVLRLAFDVKWKPTRPRLINVGAASTTSISEIVAMIEAQLGSKMAVERRSFADTFGGKKDVRDRVPVTARLEALVGPVAWPDAASIVRDVLDWMRGFREAELRRHAGLGHG